MKHSDFRGHALREGHGSRESLYLHLHRAFSKRAVSWQSDQSCNLLLPGLIADKGVGFF